MTLPRWLKVPISPVSRDLIYVVVLAIVSITVVGTFGLNEKLVLWTLAHPEYEIYCFDDLPGAFTIIALGIAWFAMRRWREYRQEAIAHTATLAQLRSALAKVEAANQGKSNFLANMSHELRTPLNAILGFSDVIRKQTFGATAVAKYRDYGEDIHTAGQHLLSVISDILDIARLEAGTLRFEPTAVGVMALLENVHTMIANSAREGDLAVEVFAEGDLAVWADADKLRQAVLNIAFNAVKFTPKGGRLRIRAERHQDSAVIRIADTGIGIAHKDIAAALTPFQQIENRLPRKFEGTGLGLPLAKYFVEQQGGTFSLESDLGQGTTVTIRMPLAASMSRAA
jgi:signal transduction histidine kinase